MAYIGVSQCRLMQCPENYSCQTVFKPQNKQIRIMSERTTYISYEHSRSHACMCDRDRGESLLGKIKKKTRLCRHKFFMQASAFLRPVSRDSIPYLYPLKKWFVTSFEVALGAIMRNFIV